MSSGFLVPCLQTFLGSFCFVLFETPCRICLCFLQKSEWGHFQKPLTIQTLRKQRHSSSSSSSSDGLFWFTLTHLLFRLCWCDVSDVQTEPAPSYFCKFHWYCKNIDFTLQILLFFCKYNFCKRFMASCLCVRVFETLITRVKKKTTTRRLKIFQRA